VNKKVPMDATVVTPSLVTDTCTKTTSLMRPAVFTRDVVTTMELAAVLCKFAVTAKLVKLA